MWAINTLLSEKSGDKLSTPHLKRSLVVLLVFAAGSASSVCAQENPATATVRPAEVVAGTEGPSVDVFLPSEESPQSFVGALSFLFENDSFASNDNRYTGGSAFLWTSAAAETYSERNLYRKIVNALSFFPTVKDGGYRNYLQFALGMEMYTGSDISVADPPLGDHPYAIILYLDSAVVSRSRVSCHDFTLRLGLVGPGSGAKDFQELLHEIVDSPLPQGWDTQLGSEPIANLFYQYGRRLPRRGDPDRFDFDFTMNGGGGIGNYYVGANLGLMARVGYRMPDTYSVTPPLGGAEAVVGLTPPRKNFYVYAYGSSQVFGILRWLPTDGNTFQESRTGDRDSWFGSLSVGLAAGYHRVVLAYRYHAISGLSDFRANNHDDFGTVVFTVFLG